MRARLALALSAALALAGPAGCSRTIIVEPAPAVRYGGAPALEHARSLARTVETIARGTGNKGRQWAAERRAEELGLGRFTRVEWIDWWTPQKNVIVELPPGPALVAATGTAAIACPATSTSSGTGTGATATADVVTETARIVYVLAHYDKIDLQPLAAVSRIFLDVLEPLLSWSYTSSGAVDNGTGCAVVLEMALEVARRPRKDRYRFIMFGSEESGLRGSRCYVAGLDPAEVARVRLAVNVDSVGIVDAPNGVVDDEREDPELVDAAAAIARRRGFDLRRWSLPRWLASSDDDPFWATSFPIDLLRGLAFNLGGALLPQRSWFTGLKHMPTVSFASPDCFDWTDIVGGLIGLPIGTIHGPRDRCSRVDPWRLYEQFEVVRELTEEGAAQAP